MFKLLRHFSITSLVAFVIVAALLGIFYRQIILNNIIEVAESKNVALAQAFSNSLWPQFALFLTSVSEFSEGELQTHPQTAALHQAVLAQMEGLSVVKIKVYNLDGLMVFSTEAEQIGVDKSDSPGFLAAQSGQVASNLTHQDTFNAFEGTVEDRNILESYIPIQRGGPTSPIEGVFEVYDDVTPLIEQSNQAQKNVFAGTTLFLTILYAGLLFVVRRADNIIQGQYYELKQGRENLQRSEERFRRVISSISDHIYMTELTEDGRHLNGYISPNVKDLTGYSSDTLMADWDFWPSTLIHPDDKAAAVAQVKRFIKGCNSEVEYRLIRADGGIIWVRDSGRVEKDNDTQNLVIYGVVSDITGRKQGEEALQKTKEELEQRVIERTLELTSANQRLQLELAERKRAREALQASEEKYRTLTNHLPIGIYRSTKEGKIIHANPALAAILEYESVEDLLEISAGTLYDTPPERDKQLEQWKASGSITSSEIKFRTQTGRRIWVRDTGRVILDKHGEIDYVDGTIEDITERKHAEEVLQKEHAFLQQVIDINPHFIFAKDREGRFTLANEAFAKAYGTTVKELLGKTDADFNPNQKLVEKYRCDDLTVMDSGQELFIPEECIVNARGEVLWRQSIKRPIMDEDGIAYQVLGVVTDITDRKRVEEELKLTQFSIDNAADAIFWIGPEAQFLYVNKAACHLLGYSQEELLAMTIYDIDPNYPPEVWPSHWKKTQHGPVTVESRHRSKNGQTFPVEVTFTYLEFDDRAYNFVFAHNITMRRWAVQALEESEERFRRVVSSISDHIYMTEFAADGKRINRYISPNIEALTGYLPEKFKADWSFWATIIHPDDRAIAATQVEQFVKGQNSEVEYRLIRANGNTIWVRDSGRVKQDAANQNIIVYGVVSDITERKQADKALEQQRAFLQQVIDINPHFIFAKDRQMRFTLANQAFATAYGTTVDGLIGKTDADLNPNPDTVDRYNHDDLAVIESNQELIIPEDQVVNIHGKKLWRYTIKRPIVDEDGRAYQVLGVATDITDLKLAEQELVKTRDQALEASRLKSQILAKVSHELRTPLNAILGYTELLQNGIFGPLSDKQIEATEEVIDSTHYLTSMVSELLDQAQLEAGKLELHISSFAPVEIINQVQSKMSVLAQAKNLTLITNVAPDIPSILSGDPKRLQQILVNLVSNAIKFTESGTVQVNLYRPDPAHWAMQITDTGAGIPIEAQSNIFEPFQQVDGSTTRKQKGTGLGLSIVKQLTTLMGGQITLKSNVGQGSAFTILLPLVPPQGKTD